MKLSCSVSNIYIFYFDRKVHTAYDYIQGCLLHLIDIQWQVGRVISLYLEFFRSRCGVVESYLSCKPGFAGSIPGFSSLSDETFNHGPISI